MEIFGIGTSELLVIALLAAIVLGPERLAKVAREAGRFVRNLKSYFTALSNELNAELTLLDELERTKRDLKKIK